MKCADCAKWLTQRVTDYDDGSRIVNFSTENGKGKCEVLNFETLADFGCVHFVEGHQHIEIMGQKKGSPWHHSDWGKCPDCLGVGWQCNRCACTGRVLYYDDGFIGEEQTRRHPNEAKIGAPPVPECMGCQRHIDKSWVACPYCGNPIDKPSEPVRVMEIL